MTILRLLASVFLFSTLIFAQSLPERLLQGIAAGDYRTDNIIEYVPVSALEVPRIYLSTPEGHPRLLRADQIAAVRQRKRQAPFARWYDLLREDARRGLEQSRLSEPVFRSAERIKNLAFVYAVEGDRRFRDAAIALLRQLPDPPRAVNFEGGSNRSGWGDYLQSAQALPAIWVAVDLLYDELDPRLRQDTRRKLLRITAQHIDAMLITPTNNHVTVMAVATLTSALMDSRPEEVIGLDRQEIWQSGLTYLSRALGLIAPDGGYAEGVYYGNFITNYLAPFAVHLENCTGLRLYQHPYLERMVNWMLANEKGSGRYSAFDDAFQVRFFYLPLIIPQSRLGRNWSAHLAARPPLQQPRDNLAEGLCIFQPHAVPPGSREPAVQFFPESGQAVFRDRPVQPRIFASWISERERWFAARHEQIDPLSFELSAFGEDLIIDAGYGSGTGDPNRPWHLSAQAHNGILVDGLGTYRNPLYGDSLASAMPHSFRTRRSAATAMRYRIGDVDITRRVLFADSRYFVMIDAVEGDRPHDIAQNFNFLGDLLPRSDQHLLLRRGDAALSLLNLNSFAAGPLLLRDFSRYTPPGKPAPAGRFRLEFPEVQRGVMISLLYPHRPGAMPQFVRQSLQGQGELLRFGPDTSGSETELAVNRGGEMESDRWRSDAAALWLRYDPAGEISALLLVNVTRFHSDRLAIQTDFPVTIYLEEGDFSWQGYLEAPDERTAVRLGVRGLQAAPLRFNRSVVIPRPGQDGMDFYDLQGSGTLDAGLELGAVEVPYAYHRAPGLIGWLNRQSQPRRQYQYWSDYQKQQLDDQVAAALWAGLRQGAAEWNRQLLNGGDLARQTAAALWGISQASYSRNSGSTYSLAIPHRYRFGGENSGLRWSVMEDGIVSGDEFNLRHVQVSARNAVGDGIAYRAAHGFAGEQNHLVRLFSGGGQQAVYQQSRAGAQREQQAALLLRGKGWQLQPGYAWRNQPGDDDAFLYWQTGRFTGRLRRGRQGGESITYQSLGGYGRRWAFALEGEQQRRAGRQRYEGSGFLQPAPHLNLAVSAQLLKAADYTLPRAAGELSYRRRGLSLRGRLFRSHSRWEQALTAYSVSGAHQISARLNLRALKFSPHSRLEGRWSYRSPAGWQLFNDWDYRYRPERRRREITLLHSLAVPLGKQHTWQPLAGENFPGRDPLQWLGSGWSYRGRHSAYGQIMLDRTARPTRVNYQAAVELFTRYTRRPLLNLWLTVTQAGERIDSSEIRLTPGSGGWQPGLYYSYLRHSGSRLEGFLEWWW